MAASPVSIKFLAMALYLASVPVGHTANAAACQLSKVAALPVTVAAGNRVLVEGSIKGQPALFQVDTGAVDTIFDASVLGRFGIADSMREARGLGATGEFTVAKITLTDLRIGNFKILSPYQVVSRTHFLPDDISALFGEDFFIAFDVDFDLKNNTINLFQNHSCQSEPVYWSTTFSEFDITVRHNAIHVPVQINGARAVAIFDTGATSSIVSWGLVRRLGLNKDSPGMTPLGRARGIGTQAEQIYGFRFSEIDVGDEAIKNPYLSIVNLAPIKHDASSLSRLDDSNDADFDMLLGADFIKAHHIYIATREGRMYFTFNGGAIFPAPAAK